MSCPNRNEYGLRPATNTHPESVKSPLGELPSNLVYPASLSSSTTRPHDRQLSSSSQSIDDLTIRLSRTRIGTTLSTKSQAHSTITVAKYNKAIDEVVHEVLDPVLQIADSEKLLPNHPCFDLARQYAKKWDISNEAVQSHIKLACGYLNFPVILLLNPAPTHEHLPFDQMVGECRTLKWIENVLEGIGLELADVMILDACTLLSNDYIRQLEEEGNGRKEQALSEAYDVTQKMLEMIKPSIIISCQCSTSFSKWGTGGHVIARELCSSMRRAKNREVRKVNISGHTINVVQAYHPSSFLRLDRCPNGKSHHDPSGKQLQDLFQKLYLPCGSWKSQRTIVSNALVVGSIDALIEDGVTEQNRRRSVRKSLTYAFILTFNSRSTRKIFVPAIKVY